MSAPVRQHQSRQDREVTWDAAFPLVPHERYDLSAFRLVQPAAYVPRAEVGGHQLPRGLEEERGEKDGRWGYSPTPPIVTQRHYVKSLLSYFPSFPHEKIKV